MDSSQYAAPDPSWLTRFLWKASGGDPHILAHCPYADHVKFACLGGIVASTGVLAFMSSAYAFFTIFSRPDAGVLNTLFWFVVSVVAGGVWGLIIFNLDRYIVASTGKGDGTEKITRQEFTNAIPRMILGIIIAVVISKPLELRIFQPEIEAELYRVRQEAQTTNRAAIEKNYNPDLAAIDEQVRKLEAEIASQQEIAATAEHEALAELDGSGGSRRALPGPIYQAKRQRAEREQQILADLRTQNTAKITALLDNRRTRRDRLEVELANSTRAVAGISGFLARMTAAHRLAGPIVLWSITLLFVAIELTPIFFKLMLIKGPYDYLEENIKEIVLARQGIERVIEFGTLNANGVTASTSALHNERVVYHQRQPTLTEKRRSLEAQVRLADLAIKSWTKEEATRITGNPGLYVQSEGNGTSDVEVVRR
jgi:hypothetical protein